MLSKLKNAFRKDKDVFVPSLYIVPLGSEGHMPLLPERYGNMRSFWAIARAGELSLFPPVDVTIQRSIEDQIRIKYPYGKERAIIASPISQYFLACVNYRCILDGQAILIWSVLGRAGQPAALLGTLYETFCCFNEAIAEDESHAGEYDHVLTDLLSQQVVKNGINTLIDSARKELKWPKLVRYQLNAWIHSRGLDNKKQYIQEN